MSYEDVIKELVEALKFAKEKIAELEWESDGEGDIYYGIIEDALECAYQEGWSE